MSHPPVLQTYSKLNPRQVNNSTLSTSSLRSTDTNPSSSTPSPSTSTSTSDTPSPTASSTSDPSQTATSSSLSPTSTSSPTPTSTQINSQPSLTTTPTPTPTSTPTSTSSNAQPTSSSSSRPEDQTSSSPPSSTSIQASTSDPPPAQSSSSDPQSSTLNTSSPSAALPSPSAQPSQNTFSRPPPASPASSQIVVITSNVYRTTTDPNGGIHTLTSYVEVTVDRPPTTISAPGGTSIAQLHEGDAHQPGFFDNRGAVIGTFLTVGLIVLGGLAAIIWRLARLRRARLRDRQNMDTELNFDKFVGNDDDGRINMLDTEYDHFQNIPLDREPQLPQISEHQLGPQESIIDPMLGYHDNPSHSNFQEGYPVRFSNRTNHTGRSSDLDTMNTEEWGRYINNHVPARGSRAFGDGLKQDLMRVDEEGVVTAGPPIVISNEATLPQQGATGVSSFHPPLGLQPEIQTVEQENFTMVSPPQFAADDQIPTADQRLEPTVLPGYHPNRPQSDDQYVESASLRDEQDYSRRILRVSNPDREDNDDQPSTT